MCVYLVKHMHRKAGIFGYTHAQRKAGVSDILQYNVCIIFEVGLLPEPGACNLYNKVGDQQIPMACLSLLPLVLGLQVCTKARLGMEV